MTRNDVSLLAVRLLALYLIVQGITALPSLSMIASWPRELDPAYSRNVQLAIASAVVAPLGLGLIMLVLSRSIAAWLGPGSKQPPAQARVALPEIQIVLIATFGLLLIAVTLPRLILAIAHLRYRNESSSIATSYLRDPDTLAQLVAVALGALLCTGARFWVRLLRRFRDFGWNQDSPGEK